MEATGWKYFDLHHSVPKKSKQKQTSKSDNKLMTGFIIVHRTGFFFKFSFKFFSFAKV